MQSLRIVDKVRYDEQTFLSIPIPNEKLKASSVRVQTKLVGLSSNNLAYCAAGEILHWWSAFPVPSSAEPPYNNTAQFGVSPGWGYATVIESTIPEIEAKSILFGFVPISSHTVDLELCASDVPEQWIEKSLQRSKVMSMYQRYVVMPRDFVLDTPKSMWTAPLIAAEAGQVLAKYVFPQDDREPIHPFGVQVSPWTKKEADLDDACIVSIASGTKTAKAFIYMLADITRNKKPGYSLVEVTSGSGCTTYLKTVPFNHKIVPYDQISADGAFPSHSRYILLNFGGRDNAFEKVFDALRASKPEPIIISVQIGSEPKVATKEIMQERQAFIAKSQAFRMNTTAIRDAAVERYGEKKYFEDLNRTFGEMVSQQTSAYDGKVLGMTLKLSNGLQTEDGIEGVWNRLIRGQIDGTEAFAVSL